jgi:putative restriction endonuclease
MARVQQVILDPDRSGMYLALIEPGSYLDFAHPVPFTDGTAIIERGLLNNDGRISGRAQSAVRLLSRGDFTRIVELGLGEEEPLLPRTDEPALTDGFSETQVPFLLEERRNRVDFLTSRVMRDRAFRRIVLRAYDERCAVTGLKLINGGGRAEVAAAHIQPVEAHGPDIVSNGIALSGTAHWMFDRGLISLSDELEILVSRQVNDPSSVRSIINRSGYALRPSRIADRPHPHFLSWHRENCFKN